MYFEWLLTFMNILLIVLLGHHVYKPKAVVHEHSKSAIYNGLRVYKICRFHSACV